MGHRLKLHRDIEKQLQRIPKNQQARLVATMRALGDQPRPHGCVKLEDQLYRVRQGEYRIIYAVFDEPPVVVVCKIARRTEATYRDLARLLERVERMLEE